MFNPITAVTSRWLASTFPTHPTLAACMHGDVKTLIDKLENGDSDSINEQIDGQLLLHTAVKFGHSEIARLLMTHGALPNSKDQEGLTAFDHAALSPHGNDILPELIAKTIDLQTEEVTQTILSNPAEFQTIKNSHQVIESTCQKHEPLLQYFDLELQKNEVSLSAFNFTEVTKPIDDEGNTLLHLFAARKNTELVRKILEATALDTNNLTNNVGQTPLHFACAMESPCIKLLLDHKYDIHQTDNSGISPLAYFGAAAHKRDPLRIDLLQFLITGLLIAQWSSQFLLRSSLISTIFDNSIQYLAFGMSIREFPDIFLKTDETGYSQPMFIFSYLAATEVFGKNVRHLYTLFQMSAIAKAAFTSIRKSWSYKSLRPLKALCHATLSTINLAHAASKCLNAFEGLLTSAPMQSNKGITKQQCQEAKQIFTNNTQFNAAQYAENPSGHLKKLWRQLALTSHPDKCEPKPCGGEFVNVKAAYETLITMVDAQPVCHETLLGSDS